MKVLSLFTGIGAFEKALKNIGIKYELVGFSEIDKFAVKSYCAIHDESENKNLGDITKIDISKLPMNIDLITHGSPCQDFSLAGKQAGGDLGTGTRSSLMWNTINIVTYIKPKYVVWENVKNLLSNKHRHNFDNYLSIMSSLGYNNYFEVLNAKDYEIPQNRERVYTISIRKDMDDGEFQFPKKEELKLKLKDLLETNVDEKYYLSEKMLNYCFDMNDVQKGSKWEGRADNETLNSDIAHALSVRGAGGNQRAGVSNFIIEGTNQELKVKELKLKIKNATKKGYEEAVEGDSVNLAYPNSKTRRGRVGHQISQTLQCNDSMGVVELLKNLGLRIRKLTPLECFRLMGFSDEDYKRVIAIGMSNTQLYKQAGNSIVVKVLEKIFKNLF